MDGAHGAVLGTIITDAIGGITGVVIAVGSSTAMCGMTLGSIPIYMTIIQVGIMGFITAIILISVLANPVGVEVQKCFPIPARL